MTGCENSLPVSVGHDAILERSDKSNNNHSRCCGNIINGLYEHISQMYRKRTCLMWGSAASEPAFRLRVLPALRYRACGSASGSKRNPGKLWRGSRRIRARLGRLAEAGFRRLSGVDHLRRLAVTEGERGPDVSKPYIPDFCVRPGYWRYQNNSGCSAPRIAEVQSKLRQGRA